MKAELIGWAAGILEGEGCFSINYRTHKSGNVHPQLAIHCEMTDEDTIDKLYGVLGVGNVYYRENDRADGRKRKPSWILSIQKQKEIFDTLLRVMPYLGERRLAKAKEMFDILEDKVIERYTS
jgi:hypothetical protein